MVVSFRMIWIYDALIYFTCHDEMMMMFFTSVDAIYDAYVFGFLDEYN